MFKKVILMQRDYDNPQYKAFRHAVRKRDKSTCQFPGCKVRKRIQVHHIVKWANNSALRYNVNNGICLCRTHHKFISGKEHNYAPIFQTIVAQKKK